jgi:nanoRNase/pAp phosphatase (c-di-AMP/oligoRNAs hydrolase)
MFKSVADKVGHGIVFKHRPDSNWVVSLYNTNIEETFHCGDYLKEKYGGGGHQGAAGCTLTQEQFISVLTKKEL